MLHSKYWYNKAMECILFICLGLLKVNVGREKHASCLRCFFLLGERPVAGDRAVGG